MPRRNKLRRYSASNDQVFGELPGLSGDEIVRLKQAKIIY